MQILLKRIVVTFTIVLAVANLTDEMRSLGDTADYHPDKVISLKPLESPQRNEAMA